MVIRPPSMALAGWTVETREADNMKGRRGKSTETIDYRLLGIVELHVPVEVVAPAFGGIAKADGDADGLRLRPARRLHQVHPGLGRRASALAPVAGDAAGDDVLPVLAAALGDRQHMVEGQFSARQQLRAVLARMLVACVDVRPGERDIVDLPLDLDVAEQTDDRGELEAKGYGPDLPVVHRNNFDLPLAPKGHRLLPVDDLQRLVRRVEKERLLHTACAI